MKSRVSFCLRALMVAILAAAPLSLMAQTARPVPPGRVRVPNNPGDNRRATDQKPCWQQAGISKAAMEQRRAIQQSTRELHKPTHLARGRPAVFARAETILDRSSTTDSPRAPRKIKIDGP